MIIMKRVRKIIVALVVFLLFIVTPITGFANNIESSYNDVSSIFESLDSYIIIPDDYLTIQQGINNANAGGSIFVRSGIYKENIVIDKQGITIVGENNSDTIIDGATNSYVISINKNNTHLENFTILNSGGNLSDCGIKLLSDGSTVKNCVFYNHRTALNITGNNNSISNCFFRDNGGAILLNSVSLNIVERCSFFRNAIGIELVFSNNNNIKDSFFYINGLGCSFINSSYNNMSGCKFANKFFPNTGMHLFNSNYNVFKFCNIYNMRTCFYVYESDFNVLENSILNDSYIGVEIIFSKGNFVNFCNICDNSINGVKLISSQDTTISNCNIFNNYLCGISTEKSGTNDGELKNSCNAKNNWWGSFFGPSITDIEKKIKKTDIIKPKYGLINYIPWESTSVQQTDLNMTFDFSLFSIPAVSKYENYVCPENDSDEDKVPDWWEVKWDYNPCVWEDHENLDPDSDGLNNVEEYLTDQFGSNPFFKDIFIEVDWMDTKEPEKGENKFPTQEKDKLIQAFLNHDIHLHIDEGNLGGGEQISYTKSIDFSKVRDIYWDYFLHNDLNNHRKGIFHYVIICEYLLDGLSVAELMSGWNQIDMVVFSGCKAKSKEWLVHGFMHELGHTFGLLPHWFQGIDNFKSPTPWKQDYWKYRNYVSVMNYRYLEKTLTYSDGSNGRNDYNDLENMDFSYFKSPDWG